MNIQSYQNTNKITLHSNSFLFACFSIAVDCCKYARMRFHCATVLVVLSICALRGNTADDAMQLAVKKSLYPFYTTREMPHVTVTITKNASLAAIVRYHGRPQKFFQGGKVDILLILCRLLTMQCKCMFIKRFTFLHHKENVTTAVPKNAHRWQQCFFFTHASFYSV